MPRRLLTRHGPKVVLSPSIYLDFGDKAFQQYRASKRHSQWFDGMQPTPFQRLFTDNRPLFFLMTMGAAVSVVWTGCILWPTLTISLSSLAWCLVLLSVAACLGAVLGAFPGGMFLGIVLQWIERRNGAPFREGDEVVILSKRYPGRVTRVYDVWAERHQVRVELDERSRQDVTDVFSFTDVCRRRSAVE